MEFGSIEEAVVYIENAISDSMNPIGQNMIDIMNESINTEIYNHHGNTTGTRTGQLGECADVVDISGTSVATEYLDKGSWQSMWGKTKGQHFFPLEGFLATTVLAPNGGRYYADPTSEALFKCIDEIPDKLKQELRSRGIPIE